MFASPCFLFTPLLHNLLFHRIYFSLSHLYLQFERLPCTEANISLADVSIFSSCVHLCDCSKYITNTVMSCQYHASTWLVLYQSPDENGCRCRSVINYWPGPLQMFGSGWLLYHPFWHSCSDYKPVTCEWNVLHMKATFLKMVPYSLQNKQADERIITGSAFKGCTHINPKSNVFCYILQKSYYECTCVSYTCDMYMEGRARMFNHHWFYQFSD